MSLLGVGAKTQESCQACDDLGHQLAGWPTADYPGD
jgi:hypothetical protein